MREGKTMKYDITCCDCHKEFRVDCGSGKQGEYKYNRIKDSWTCPECFAKWRDKQRAEEFAAETAKKADEGWKKITVHYAEFKKNYQDAVNVHGEKVKKGEYHAEDKTIDLLVPQGKLVKLDTLDLALLERDEPLPFSETEEEFKAKKAALLARFEEPKEEAEEPEVVEEDVAEAADGDYEPEAAEDFEDAIEWEALYVNACYVEKMTDKGVLLRMPSKSDYAGYTFWFPRKCFKKSRVFEYQMLFKDDWKFTLKANGGALVVELEGSSFNDALPAHGFMRYEEKDEKYVPLPMKPVEIEADEELVDDED